MSRHKYSVTVTTCDSARTVYETRVIVPTDGMTCSEAHHEALFRAVRKLFGARAYFSRDSMVPGRFGQVWRPTRYGGSEAITGRVKVTIVRQA